MGDWIVWPVFIVEAVAFIALFFKPSASFIGISSRSWVITLILITAVMILLSLNHDSTTTLRLHF